MTRASESFYYRRSGLCRISTTTAASAGISDLEFDSSSDPDLHCIYNRRPHQNCYNHRHQHRRHFDGCDPVRLYPPVLPPGNRVPYPEHASVRHEQCASQSVSSNHINTQNLISARRPRVTRNDRLPRAVLLARERLLERLRGVFVSENRLSDRTSPSNYRSECLLGDDLGLANADWETDIPMWWSGEGSYIISQSERPQKKPPGLTQEALDHLHLEVYSSTDQGIAEVISRALKDSSICLENFTEGDKLICLPCGHRFHPPCLKRWVQTCGGCPYCRKGIVLSIHRP